MNNFVYVQDGEVVEKSVGSFSDELVNGFFNYTLSNSQLLPGWWQHSREAFLQKAAIENDLLSMALWNLQMLLESLPFVIRPRNSMIDAHFRIAEFYDNIIRDSLNKMGSQLILDMLVHDMGGYAVIDSDTSWSQPLTGVPTGLTHLVSSNIIMNASGSKIHPIIYIDSDRNSIRNRGNIKIHESRIIKLTQLPFAITEDSQVGLSFVSRAFNVAEVMRSVNIHALEQLGELEAQRIIWGTDTTGKEIKRAFSESHREARQTGKIRTSGNVYLGMRSSNAKIGMLDLKNLPNNFDWEKFTKTTLHLLAFAAGVDVNDLISIDAAGTSKNAVAISDLKSKQKLYTWYCNTLKRQIEAKILPRDLEFVVGNAENDISEAKARTFTSLSRSNKFSIDSGTIDERTSREIQLRHGMLTQEQVFFMELDNGRLPDGLPVSAVFFKKEQGLQKFLPLDGFEEPWMVDLHEPEDIIPAIQRKIFSLQGEVINAESRTRHKQARIALAAYEWLLGQYEAKALLSQFDETAQEDSGEALDNEEVIEDVNTVTTSPEAQKSVIFSTTTQKGRLNNKRLKTEVRKSFKQKELDLDSLSGELREILVEWDVHDDILEDVLDDFISIAEQLRFNEVVKNKKLTNVLDTFNEIMDELDF